MILTIIFVVLMMFWLFFGYTSWDGQNHAVLLGTSIIPFLCVAILGWVLFGGSK